MYKKLLVAFDGSESSCIAVIHASLLAKKLNAELVGIWVSASTPHYFEAGKDAGLEFFEKLGAQLESMAASQGVEIQQIMRVGHPAQQIVAFARESGSDLIVLGNRGHSRLWGELLGRTADRVSEQAPCSVLVVRSKNEDIRYDSILIGYDGSAGAETALNHGLALAKAFNSKTRALWIHERPPMSSDALVNELRKDDEWALEFFNVFICGPAERTILAHGVSADTDYKIGPAAQTIIEEAKAGGFRLIVLGHRGHSGLWGKLIGGVADRVSHHARCDVLVVREKETPNP